jgi:hypothetical protein
VAVEELSTVSYWYKSELGDDGEAVERQELQARGARFQVGPHYLEFLKPATSESSIADRLHALGSSPYSATLKTRSHEVLSLDSNLTHGARLSFE